MLYRKSDNKKLQWCHVANVYFLMSMNLDKIVNTIYFAMHGQKTTDFIVPVKKSFMIFNKLNNEQ